MARGFGLLVVVMAILGLGVTAGVIALSAKSVLDARGGDATRVRLKRLAEAGRRYEASVGRPPAALEDLLTRPGSVPECALSPVTGELAGWCGPYWRVTFEGEAPFADGWGNRIRLDVAARKVTSPGPDGADGGDDDLAAAF